MQLRFEHGLPFVEIELTYRGKATRLTHALVDTGSAGTVMSADVVAAIDLTPAPDDILRVIRGVGGTEAVFSRRIDRIAVGDQTLEDFEIEVGGMDYGFAIQGILGTDFLRRAGAVIDLSTGQLFFSESRRP